MTRRFLREEEIDLEKFSRETADRFRTAGLNNLQCRFLIVSAYDSHTLLESINDAHRAEKRFNALKEIADNFVSDPNALGMVTVDDVVAGLLSAIGSRKRCDDVGFLWKFGRLLEKWEKLDSQSVAEYATKKGRIRKKRKN